MDTLSHALWGYASMRWRGPRTARWSLLTGSAPDLIFGATSVVGRLLTYGWGGLGPQGERDPRIWLRDGPPMPADLVEDYERYYVWSHSLFLLLGVAVIWIVLRRRPPWLLLPWLLHVLMDIPAHERYLTPFLHPFSDWRFEGWGWGRAPMLALNWGSLLLVYAMLYARYWSRHRKPRVVPWPEEVTGVA
jgi:hypothetical protein